MTAEVGGEGGSYADAAVQAETFSGDNPPADGRARPAGSPDTPLAPDDRESPADGTRKYPTE